MRLPIFPRPVLFRLLAVLCGAGCLFCGAACHREEPPAPKAAPSIDGLTEVLKHTADQALTAGSLTEQVTLTGGTAEQATVLKIISEAGGVGVYSPGTAGRISILATVPKNNEEAFKAALHHVNVSMEPASPETDLIEVIIQPPGSSPTP